MALNVAYEHQSKRVKVTPGTMMVRLNRRRLRYLLIPLSGLDAHCVV